MAHGREHSSSGKPKRQSFCQRVRHAFNAREWFSTRGTDNGSTSGQTGEMRRNGEPGPVQQWLGNSLGIAWAGDARCEMRLETPNAPRRTGLCATRLRAGRASIKLLQTSVHGLLPMRGPLPSSAFHLAMAHLLLPLPLPWRICSWGGDGAAAVAHTLVIDGIWGVLHAGCGRAWQARPSARR